MERLAYGAFDKMTPEQQKEHKRALQRKWRAENKDVISRRNHMWYLRYKTTKPFVATCMFCGKSFNATRSYYKTCPECTDSKHTNFIIRTKECEARSAQRNIKYNEVEKLHKQGFTQRQIADALSITQSGVSYIITKRKKKMSNKKAEECLDILNDVSARLEEFLMDEESQKLLLDLDKVIDFMYDLTKENNDGRTTTANTTSHTSKR